jgi:UDP-glucose 4-epimerase
MQQGNWLVIGGAGYVGSHFVEKLIESGTHPIVIDNLSTGYADRIFLKSEFIEMNCNQFQKLHDVLINHQIENIAYFAARRQARESMYKPVEYWIENSGLTLNLIKAVIKSPVRRIIYSSSCSVYGDSGKVNQSSLLSPASVYGRTKLNSEDILRDCAREVGYRLAILRYFNVVGASENFNGYDRTPGAIVPTFVNNLNDSNEINIFGQNFSTKDGTAIRDYIDVRDLVDAHLLAHREMQSKNADFEAFVSSGKPKSVLEIAKLVAKQLGTTPQINFKQAAVGDPGEVWADLDPRLEILGWKANFNVEESIQSHIDTLQKFQEKIKVEREI